MTALKRYLLLAATALSAGFGCVPAHAYVASGYDWMAACSNGDGASSSACLNYARGLADGLAMWVYGSPQTAKICIPGYLMTIDLVRVGETYFRAHYPETMKME